MERFWSWNNSCIVAIFRIEFSPRSGLFLVLCLQMQGKKFTWFQKTALLSFADKQKRRQRFSYHRFSREQMKRRKKIFALTLQKISSVKWKDLSWLGLFFSRLHRAYDKSSCRNKRMIHLPQMNRKCRMFLSPDDFTKNILLCQKDQISIWLH